MKKDSYNTEIIVNVHPLEKRVAVLEDSRLVELFVERREQQNIVGNIYKGIVKDVEGNSIILETKKTNDVINLDYVMRVSEIQKRKK